MSLSSALTTIKTDCNEPTHLKDYLLAEGITDIEDVALLAADEKVMEDTILESIKAPWYVVMQQNGLVPYWFAQRGHQCMREGQAA